MQIDVCASGGRKYSFFEDFADLLNESSQSSNKTFSYPGEIIYS